MPAKPISALQQAAFEVIDAWETNRLAPAVRKLDEVLRASLSKPVGRPRVRPHDPTLGKSCMCIDCRKRRKLSRISHTQLSKLEADRQVGATDPVTEV